MTGFVYFCITSVRFELENGTDVNCQLISVELFRTELQGFYYMLQLCVCLRDREATDTRIDWARCSALRKDLTPMKCPIHRNSWWAQLLSILQILQWYCMMSRWTVVLLINFGIAYHIMSVTVLGWRNGHGPMIWYIPWSSWSYRIHSLHITLSQGRWSTWVNWTASVSLMACRRFHSSWIPMRRKDLQSCWKACWICWVHDCWFSRKSFTWGIYMNL